MMTMIQVFNKQCQALLASSQQFQPQGSDPTASSSAAVQRSTQQELLDELEVGRSLDG